MLVALGVPSHERNMSKWCFKCVSCNIVVGVLLSPKAPIFHFATRAPVSTTSTASPVSTHLRLLTFLTLFIISSGSDMFRFQLKQCEACITVSAVCNRSAQQDLIIQIMTILAGAPSCVQEKPIKLWPWAYVTRCARKLTKIANNQEQAKEQHENWIHISTWFEGCAEGSCSIHVLHVTPSTSSW